MMRWFYLRDENKFPVACVASELDAEGNIRFAVSAFNPRDRFDRHVAIGYAVNRLIHTGDGGTIFGKDRAKERIIERIADPDQRFPRSAQKAAVLWLENRKGKTAA